MYKEQIMIKSKSAPCLLGLERSSMRRSISCQAFTDTMHKPIILPTNPIEEVGLSSILHMTHQTVVDCLPNSKFPQALVQTDNDDAHDLACCIATPSEMPETLEPVFKRDDMRYHKWLMRYIRRRLSPKRGQSVA